MHSLGPLISCVLATADAFRAAAPHARTLLDAETAAPLRKLRAAAAAATAAGASTSTSASAVPGADAVPGAPAAPSELSSLVGSVEAVLGCLLRVRASSERRRDEAIRQKAATLAQTRRELDALQPQHEAAIRRAKAKYEAELNSLRAPRIGRSASLIRRSTSLSRMIASLIRYEAEANSLRAELAAAVAREEASAAAARELEAEMTNLRHAQIEASAVASASEAGLSRKLREAQRAAEEGQRMADRWKAERNEALGLRAASEAAAAAYQVID